jgi:hypothetical protein
MPEGNIDGSIGKKSYPYVVNYAGSKKEADKLIKSVYKDRLFATGKYQFTPPTLEATARKAGISLDTKYTPEVQERLARYKLNERISSSGGNAEKAARALANEWASLPIKSKKKDGKTVGAYEGTGNKAKESYSFEQTVDLVKEYFNTGNVEPLLKYIAEAESNGSYIAKNAGTVYLSNRKYNTIGRGKLKGLTNMTIREILERR